MKRATVTIPDDLEGPIEAFGNDQALPTPFTSIVQAALREYLAARGYIAPAKPFKITPAKHGSGHSDVSIEHDRHFAER